MPLSETEFDGIYSRALIDSDTGTIKDIARCCVAAVTAPLLAQIAALEAQLLEAKIDADRLDYMQRQGATVEILPGSPDFYPVHFRVGSLYRTADESIRAAIDAAIAQELQNTNGNRPAPEGERR